MARKKWIPPILVNVNMANRNLHMYGHLKLQTEFCLFGGARGPPWAPRLELNIDFLWKIDVSAINLTDVIGTYWRSVAHNFFLFDFQIWVQRRLLTA